MHDLIAKGAGAVRRRKGWTQEQAASAYRACGLTSWRTGTVGSLEAGMRRPRLDEVILMCAALDVTLADLVRAADEDGSDQVELGDGAVLSTRVILGWLYEGFSEIGRLPHRDPRATMRYPVSEKRRELVRQAIANEERLRPALMAIAAWGVQRDVRINHLEYQRAFGTPSDAERHAARRLHVDPAQVRLAARALWNAGFDEERDARVGDVEEMEPRSRQARRGLVTREMLAEMERALAEAGEAPPGDGDLWYGKLPAWWFAPDTEPVPGEDGRLPHAFGHGPEDQL
jgi:transcriptional regulator with XRE-family HTH domain